jgi:hypothetical protein
MQPACVQAELRAIEKEHTLRHLRDAQQRKDQVLQAVAAMELPNNPLDSLIDLLGGTSAVAEMTGASRGAILACWSAFKTTMSSAL